MNIAYDVYKADFNPTFLGTISTRFELQALLEQSSIVADISSRNENGQFRLEATALNSMDEVDTVVLEMTGKLSLVPNFAVTRGGFSSG